MNLPSSLLELLDNSVLGWSLIACFFAQFSKLFIELIFSQSWRPSVLIETGGMPSSHSALVTATAAGIGLEIGFDHPEFALASTLAFIVMYDASGIRKEAGNIASRVNSITETYKNEASENELKENLGHTKLEVIVGSIIGPLIAIPGILFLGSPLHIINALAITMG